MESTQANLYNKPFAEIQPFATEFSDGEALPKTKTANPSAKVDSDPPSQDDTDGNNNTGVDGKAKEETQRRKDPLFQERESLLTVALREPNTMATFSVLLSIPVLMAGTHALHAAIDARVFWRDVSMLAFLVRDWQVFFALLLLMTSSMTALLLPATLLWSRGWIGTRSLALPVAASVACVVAAATYGLTRSDLSPPLRLALLLETTRHLMKLVSFVCEKVSLGRRRGDVSLHSFLYFMFAPTLVYRESYPRTRAEQGTRVALALFNACFYFALLIAAAAPVYWAADACLATGVTRVSRQQLVHLLMLAHVAGFLMNAAIGFAFLHAYSNAAAEVLRFADRGFYANWWTAGNVYESLRHWNAIVTRWLKAYVQRPVLRLTRSHTTAVLSVLVVSGVAHDAILSLASGFLLPTFTLALLLLIPLSPLIPPFMTCLARLPLPPSNMCNILSYVLPSGLTAAFAFAEYRARRDPSCPAPAYVPQQPRLDYLIDLLVPRLASCFSIDWDA